MTTTRQAGRISIRGDHGETHYGLDPVRVRRAGKNVASLVVELAELVHAFQRQSASKRRRISADVQSLLKRSSRAQSGLLSRAILEETERILTSRDGLALMSKGLRAKALAKHTTKVSGEEGCLGQSGAGIRVQIDDVNVGACVTGTVSSGPTGGGVSGGFSY